MSTLLVLAAGMGSRYGGLKQLDPVGPSGETLLDYSVYDAIRAGFSRIVFLIRRDIEKEFREKIGTRYEGKTDIGYAFQALDDLPGGFIPTAARTKPWGTAQAIWCARDTVKEPFAALNADDFYGADSFRRIGSFLQSVDVTAQPANFAMVGYRLDKTLSNHGTVARGICEVDARDHLVRVEELTDIARAADGRILGGGRELAGDVSVSMNFWGFTPQVFPLLEKALREFLAGEAASEKSESYIPTAVAQMVAEGSATVRVLPTSADWFGVTYRGDRPRVVESITRLVSEGAYPAGL